VVKRIFAWQTDTAGCFMYRLYLPLTSLNPQQWQASWGAPPDDVFDYDVVIGQRIAGENEGWERICKSNAFAIYDIDDDLLNIDPDNHVPYSIYAPIVEATKRNIAMADLVTASTEKLAEYLRTINSNVVVLPNCLPPGMTQRPTQWSRGITVGWGGSMFHGQDFGGMGRILQEVQQEAPWVSFHMVGANYVNGWVPTRSTGWSDVMSYHNALDFSIGLAPVSQTPFNDRKSWIKVLEYAGLGIPAIATNWGQYPEWIKHGNNGFLVEKPEDWKKYILMLVNDHSMREGMSHAQRNKASQWTIDKQIWRWEKAYDTAN
jgi:hypothetical protein